MFDWRPMTTSKGCCGIVSTWLRVDGPASRGGTCRAGGNKMNERRPRREILFVILPRASTSTLLAARLGGFVMFVIKNNNNMLNAVG